MSPRTQLGCPCDSHLVFKGKASVFKGQEIGHHILTLHTVFYIIRSVRYMASLFLRLDFQAFPFKKKKSLLLSDYPSKCICFHFHLGNDKRKKPIICDKGITACYCWICLSVWNRKNPWGIIWFCSVVLSNMQASQLSFPTSEEVVGWWSLSNSLNFQQQSPAKDPQPTADTRLPVFFLAE